MKILVLLPFLTSCAWMEDYTAADAARKLMPNRVGWAYTQGEGDVDGEHKGYDTENDAWTAYLEWDLLAQPVRVESFGAFRQEQARMPVEDPVTPQVLEELQVLPVILEKLVAVEEDAEDMRVELEGIHGEVNAEEFIDKLWVKISAGLVLLFGAGGGAALMRKKKENGQKA